MFKRWFLILVLSIMVQATTDQCSAPPTGTGGGQSIQLVPKEGSKSPSPNARMLGETTRDWAIRLGCYCYDQQGQYPCNLPPANLESLAWGCLPR